MSYSQGAWSAVLAKASTLLAVGQTRLELLGNELEVGRVKAMRLLLLAQALLFCVALAVVLTVITLALLFWQHRLMVVAVAATLVWLLAWYFYLALRQGAKKTEPLFSASLAELQEDLRQLKAAAEHGRTPD